MQDLPDKRRAAPVAANENWTAIATTTQVNIGCKSNGQALKKPL